MDATWRAFQPYDLSAVLSMKLRPIDELECRASTGLLPQQALLSSLHVSTDGLWVITLDTLIIGVFGVAPLPNQMGAPWLLATDDLRVVSRKFLRESRKIVNTWQRYYVCLTNFVAAENHEAIRWLQWLGFRVEKRPLILHDPKVDFFQFYRFSKEQNHV